VHDSLAAVASAAARGGHTIYLTASQQLLRHRRYEYHTSFSDTGFAAPGFYLFSGWVRHLGRHLGVARTVPLRWQTVALMDYVLDRVQPDEGWKDIWRSPGMSSSMIDFISLAKRQKLLGSDDSRLPRSLRLLWSEYECCLRDCGWATPEDLYEQVTERWREDRDRIRGAVLVVEGFHHFTALQRSLLVEASSSFESLSILLPCDPRRPEMFDPIPEVKRRLGSLWQHVTLVSPEGGALSQGLFAPMGHPARSSGCPGTGELPQPAPEITLVDAADEREERRTLIRLLKEMVVRGGTSPSECCVVSPDPGQRHAIARAAVAAGLPVAGVPSLEFSDTAVARTILAIARAMARPTAGNLNALARSRYVDPECDPTTSEGSPVNDLLARLDDGRSEDEPEAPAVLLDLLRRLKVEEGVFQRARHSGHAGARAAADLLAWQRFSHEFLAGMDDLPPGSLSSPLSLLRALEAYMRRAGAPPPLSPQDVGGWVPEGRGLCITSPEQLAGRYAVVAVVGLNAGEFPPNHPPHWLVERLLGDDERAHEVRRLRGQNDRYQFVKVTASAGSRLILSRSKKTRGQPCTVSPFLEELLGVWPQELVTRAPADLGRLDEPSLAVDLPQLRVALLLRHRTRRWEPRRETPSWLWSDLALERAMSERVEAARAGLLTRGGSRWSGHLDGQVARRRVERLLAAGPISPTGVNVFAECPFRFLVRLWGLREVEKPSLQVSPIDIGSLCHRVLRRVAERWSAVHDGAVIEPAQLREVLTAALCDELNTLKASYPHLDPVWWEVQERNTHRTLSRLLESEITRWESSDRALSPWSAEVSFATECEWGEPCAVGPSLRLRGVIDRVDLSPDRTEAVLVDYKLGDKKNALDAMRAGQDLQLPLYVWAAERALSLPGNLRVEGCAYYSIRDGKVSGGAFTSRGAALFGLASGSSRRQKMILDETDWRSLVDQSPARLQALVKSMMDGYFPTAPQSSDLCRRCEAALACRRQWNPGAGEGPGYE